MGVNCRVTILRHSLVGILAHAAEINRPLQLWDPLHATAPTATEARGAL
jgi:hypothetical protein